jgi:hypothetical protein
MLLYSRRRLEVPGMVTLSRIACGPSPASPPAHRRTEAPKTVPVGLDTLHSPRAVDSHGVRPFFQALPCQEHGLPTLGRIFATPQPSASTQTVLRPRNTCITGTCNPFHSIVNNTYCGGSPAIAAISPHMQIHIFTSFVDEHAGILEVHVLLFTPPVIRGPIGSLNFSVVGALR